MVPKMMRANDPRIRQTINQITHNLESANETAQEGFYTFAHEYLSPCFATIGNCLRTCTAPCFPSREDKLRRRRRGRAELSFDFYDDWDNDDAGDGLLGWGNDELDRLLAGSGVARGSADQPRRQRKMSYGTRSGRRRGMTLPDERNDPTVIPKSSILGFLERFPWKIGPRGIKYRPSASDLQERPRRTRVERSENQPLMEATGESDEDSDYNAAGRNGMQGRRRSGTQSSRETSNSLSSRGDLIPSDEEEDAVPLDDEFAVALTRRNTGFGPEDLLRRKANSSRRSTSGTTSRDTVSRDSRSIGGGKSRSDSRGKSPVIPNAGLPHDTDIPSMGDWVKGDERVVTEESEIVDKRHLPTIGPGLKQGDKLPSLVAMSQLQTTPATTASNFEFKGHATEGVSPTGIISVPTQRQTRQTTIDYQPADPIPPLPLSASSANSGSLSAPLLRSAPQVHLELDHDHSGKIPASDTEPNKGGV